MIHITDHVVQSLKRRLEQFKNKPNLQAVLEIYLDQIQEAEDALYALFGALDINTQEGLMLDLIGEIVGRPRTTTSDPRYRILLWVKIAQNISEGEPERVISVFKLLTESEYVHHINLLNAEVQVQVTNDFTDQDEVDLVYRETQKVVAAGVRISVILVADPIEAFAYSGINIAAPALGYDDGFGSGGKYAKHYVPKPPFAYAGIDTGAQGYGAGGADPLCGGVYVV